MEDTLGNGVPSSTVFCPRCGQLAPQGGASGVCLSCGATLLKTDATNEPAGKAAKRSRLDTGLGWAFSASLHLLVLLLLLPFVWVFGSGGGGAGEGAEVGIVGVDEGDTMKAGDTSLDDMGESMTGLTTSELASDEPQPFEDIGDIGQTAPTGKMDAPMGTDMGSGFEIKGGGSPFDGIGGGGGGVAGFMGIAATGNKFVFVIDHSGSMSGAKLQSAKVELTKSITALEPEMQFFIIFYDNRYLAMPASGLVRASEANKKKYLAWVESIGGGGGTEPVAGMQAALALKPDAIWLLSDGLFDGQDADLIGQANPGKRTQIHTIAFYDNAGEAVLQKIAEDNRGKYRFVSGLIRP